MTYVTCTHCIRGIIPTTDDTCAHCEGVGYIERTIAMRPTEPESNVERDARWLTAELSKDRVHDFADGTVIRWKSDGYTYTALYVADKRKWYTSSRLTSVISTPDLLDILRMARSVEIASEWRVVF